MVRWLAATVLKQNSALDMIPFKKLYPQKKNVE